MANGLGYTMLTYAAVQYEVQRKALTIYPSLRPTLSTRVTIVPRRDKQLPKTTRDASALLHEVCRALVRSGQWAGAQLSR
mgnify:FL=1